MSVKDIHILKFMFRESWKPLLEVENELNGFVIKDFSSVTDLINYLAQHPEAVVLTSIRDKNDLVQLSNFMKLSKRFVKATTCKMSVINFSGEKHFENAFMTLGVRETIDPNVNRKILKFKMDLWLKGIQSQMRVGSDSYANPMSDKKKKIDLAPPVQNFNLIEALEQPDDIWLLNKETDCKKVLSKWLVKLMGPSPHVGQWNLSQTGIWIFDLKPHEKKNFLSGSGNWYFKSEQKPDFVWKENVWLLSGTAFELLYRDRDKEYSRVKFKGKELTLSKNSEFALSKKKLILQSMNKELVFSKENQEAEDAERISSEEENHLKNLEGKGKTEHLKINPLAGNTTTAADVLKNLEGEINENTDPQGHDLKGEITDSELASDNFLELDNKPKGKVEVETSKKETVESPVLHPKNQKETNLEETSDDSFKEAEDQNKVPGSSPPAPIIGTDKIKNNYSGTQNAQPEAVAGINSGATSTDKIDTFLGRKNKSAKEDSNFASSADPVSLELKEAEKSKQQSKDLTDDKKASPSLEAKSKTSLEKEDKKNSSVQNDTDEKSSRNTAIKQNTVDDDFDIPLELDVDFSEEELEEESSEQWDDDSFLKDERPIFAPKRKLQKASGPVSVPFEGKSLPDKLNAQIRQAQPTEDIELGHAEDDLDPELQSIIDLEPDLSEFEGHGKFAKKGVQAESVSNEELSEHENSSLKNSQSAASPKNKHADQTKRANPEGDLGGENSGNSSTDTLSTHYGGKIGQKAEKKKRSSRDQAISPSAPLTKDEIAALQNDVDTFFDNFNNRALPEKDQEVSDEKKRTPNHKTDQVPEASIDASKSQKSSDRGVDASSEDATPERKNKHSESHSEIRPKVASSQPQTDNLDDQSPESEDNSWLNNAESTPEKSKNNPAREKRSFNPAPNIEKKAPVIQSTVARSSAVRSKLAEAEAETLTSDKVNAKPETASLEAAQFLGRQISENKVGLPISTQAKASSQKPTLEKMTPSLDELQAFMQQLDELNQVQEQRKTNLEAPIAAAKLKANLIQSKNQLALQRRAFPNVPSIQVAEEKLSTLENNRTQVSGFKTPSQEDSIASEGTFFWLVQKDYRVLCSLHDFDSKTLMFSAQESDFSDDHTIELYVEYMVGTIRRSKTFESTMLSLEEDRSGRHFISIRINQSQVSEFKSIVELRELEDSNQFKSRRFKVS